MKELREPSSLIFPTQQTELQKRVQSGKAASMSVNGCASGPGGACLNVTWRVVVSHPAEAIAQEPDKPVKVLYEGG